MKTILIVKTSAIGDVIQTLPVLNYLRARYPHAHIDWIVEKPSVSLLQAHTSLSRCLCIDTKKWRKSLFHPTTWRVLFHFFKNLRKTHYDLIVDLQGNSKSALFTYFAKAKQKVGYGVDCVPEKLNLLSTTHRYSIPSHLSISKRYLSLIQAHLQNASSVAGEGYFTLTNQEEEQLAHIN